MHDFETHPIGTSDRLTQLEAKLEKYEEHDGMDGAIVHAIREMLYSQNVPRAAYIDDHVANAIVQRNIAEDKLKKAITALNFYQTIFEQCDITTGVCCCGENMETHSEPMDCGHTPVDQGVYSAHNHYKHVKELLLELENTNEN